METSVGSFEGDGAEAAAFLLLGAELQACADGPSPSPLESADSPDSCDSGGGSAGSSCSGFRGSSGGGSGGSVGSSAGGSGAGLALLSLLGGLLLVFSFGLIWWAIFHATGAAELPFLMILVLSIMFGLFLGLVVFKIRDFIGLYLETAITASIVNIVASFFKQAPALPFS